MRCILRFCYGGVLHRSVFMEECKRRITRRETARIDSFAVYLVMIAQSLRSLERDRETEESEKDWRERG